jgi:hypothetical protein
MSPIYAYRYSGRRTGSFVGLFFSLVFLPIAIFGQAPWYAFLPVVFAIGMCLWAVVRNPQYGSDLTAQRLTFFANGKTEAVAIDDIARMTISRWTDGPDEVALHLKSGSQVKVPSMCADSKLAIALKNLGIPDSDDNTAPVN